jgi:hypothetical protein
MGQHEPQEEVKDAGAGLRPDAFRGTLWLQAVAWEVDRLLRSTADPD